MSSTSDELSIRVLAAAIAGMPIPGNYGSGQCTGTTRSGAQCTRNGDRGLENGDPACWAHTSEERRRARKDAEREARISVFQQLSPQQQEERLRYVRIFISAQPACWSWPAEPPLEEDYWRERRADLEREGYTGQALEMLWKMEQAVPFSGMAALRMWQGGRCAVCEQTGVEMVTDHDHATGLVRGLLCRSCNTREGFSYAPGEGRDVYIAYRKRPPMAILGLRIRYLDPFTGEYAEPVAESPHRSPALSMLHVQDDDEGWEDNASAGLT